MGDVVSGHSGQVGKTYKMRDYWCLGSGEHEMPETHWKIVSIEVSPDETWKYNVNPRSMFTIEETKIFYDREQGTKWQRLGALLGFDVRSYSVERQKEIRTRQFVGSGSDWRHYPGMHEYDEYYGHHEMLAVWYERWRFDRAVRMKTTPQEPIFPLFKNDRIIAIYEDEALGRLALSECPGDTDDEYQLEEWALNERVGKHNCMVIAGK